MDTRVGCDARRASRAAVIGTKHLVNGIGNRRYACLKVRRSIFKYTFDAVRSLSPIPVDPDPQDVVRVMPRLGVQMWKWCLGPQRKRNCDCFTIPPA